MSNNWPGYMTIVLFIAITAMGFALWVGGLLGVWLLLGIVGISTDLWAMIESLSTALAAAAVFGAGFVAYRELSEVASTRHMDVANRLFQELNSPVNIEARRWIFQNLPANPDEGLRAMTPEGQAAVKQVLNSLDHVAFLTQAGWIPEALVMPWMHPMIAKSWEKLEPYVKHERVRRNEPYYYRYAGELAERCHAWRARHLADSKVTWVEEAL